MKVHIIMHESFEAPGAIITWAQNNNHQISYSCLYQGDKLPKNEKPFDFLVIMGGPQSASTTIKESPHFDAEKEIEFIKQSIDDKKIVLGICLGAQLIGEALGAKFSHSPNREIGVFNITLAEEAKKIPAFAKFPSEFPVGHWHGDMPGLTPDAKILAYSQGCPRQIVRYTSRVYGFQCHFEFTPECIEGMIFNCVDELEKYKGLPYIQTTTDLRSYDCKSFNKLLFEFLDYLVKKK